MLCEVEPFDQLYDAPADAVRITVEPAQNVVAPLGEMLAAATGLSN